MKLEAQAIETPLGNVYAPGFPGQSVMDATKSGASKRKASPGEEAIGGETEEQKQKRARGRPRLDTKDETAADVST